MKFLKFYNINNEKNSIQITPLYDLDDNNELSEDICNMCGFRFKDHGYYQSFSGGAPICPNSGIIETDSKEEYIYFKLIDNQICENNCNTCPYIIDCLKITQWDRDFYKKEFKIMCELYNRRLK